MSFREISIDTASLFNIGLSSLVVALGIFEGGQVVISTSIVGINLRGQLIDSLSLGRIFLQSSSIKNLFDAQFGGISLELVEDLLVATTDGLVIDGKA